MADGTTGTRTAFGDVATAAPRLSTRDVLYGRAQELDGSGGSTMTKDEPVDAVVASLTADDGRSSA